MTSKQDRKAPSRRDFLKLATASAPAAVAAATFGADKAAATETDATSGTRLQDTAHIRAYYASARF